jgi:O-methyltransferase involved in polyketide biosynthesis
VARLSSSASISPTAHYTGYTWARYGLSDPALVTRTGHLMVSSLRPVWDVAGRVGLPTLDGVLLGRHQLLDHLLTVEIESGRIAQVIEVAAGLSPRGLLFSRKYGTDITYVEADLPDMAEHKRRLLNETGPASPTHKIVTLDALADSGRNSLPALARTLDPSRGLAIVTEGLINYFDTATVEKMWARFATTLHGFDHGVYLSDIHVKDANASPLIGMFSSALSTFVRGRVHLHFDNPAAAVKALTTAGFDDARLLSPSGHPAVTLKPGDPGARLVHVIEARTS